MKLSTFVEANIVYAKDQPEYLPLPAFVDDMQTILCWELTWKERFKVLLNGCVWVRQLNFRQPLQPQQIEVDSPFENNSRNFVTNAG